jgi:spermidine synthase
MWTRLARWRQWWQSLDAENAAAVDGISDRWTRWGIVLASALALYVEMVMIRWHATSSHVFAIFKNVSLLSCFLGLGTGFAMAARGRRTSLAVFLPLLAVQTVLFGLIATTVGGRRVNPVAEQLVMGLPSDQWNWLHVVEGDLFLAAIFALNAVMFIPLGFLTGRLMSRLPSVQGYSLNLLGSLAGIVIFFLLSLAWTPPSVWLGVAVLGAVPFLMGTPRMLLTALASAAVMVVSLGTVGRLEERRYYSPYQAITLRLPKEADTTPVPTIKVNHCFYQQIADCTPASIKAHPDRATTADYYNLPYRLRREPGDVLVVGAGSGNDAAAALRNGASSVTAVEIDPAIVYLGRRLHPERPYHDPRTKVVINDARSHLRQTNDQYDTIIYGLLDSHTNLGAMTNVRLDSFVYTLEGFREAVARLKPGGLLVVSYQVLDPRQADKLYAMLERAYPEAAPRVFDSCGGMTYVTGPGLKQVPRQMASAGIAEQTAQFAQRTATAAVATDDWPYFYMQKRTYPLTYAVMILILLGVSLWLVKKKLGTPGKPTARTGVFFFLGAGFMLIETKVITELGLVLGNTWTVNAVAVTAILIMAWLANLWIQRRGAVNQVISFALLGAALALGLGVHWLSSAGFPLPLARFTLPLVLTAPLFFAGLIFSSTLAQGDSASDAISANLFGAMLGGFLEYNSMYWGLSSLYPLGMGLYALAFGCLLVSRRQTPAKTSGSPAITVARPPASLRRSTPAAASHGASR